MRHAAVTLLSCLLGAILLVAALAKLAAFDSFITYLSGVRFSNPTVAAVFAVLIPSLEITIGTLYLGKHPSRVHVIAGLSLFGAFLVFQVLASIPALHLTQAPCPCFGNLFPKEDAWQEVGRTAAMFVLALVHFKLSGLPASDIPLTPAAVLVDAASVTKAPIVPSP